MLDSGIYWIGLTALVLVFWLLHGALRHAFLAISGLIIVAYFDALSAFFLVLMSVLSFLLIPYLSGNSKGRGWAVVAFAAALVGPLVYFKSGIVVDVLSAQPVKFSADVLVPLGMSYYSFRLIHVVVEAYKRRIARCSAEHFFCYAFLATIVPAGPIQRLDLFLAQPVAEFDWDHILHGTYRICLGLIKQVLILEFILQQRYAVAGVSSLTLQVLEHATFGQKWAILACSYIGSLINLSAYTDIAIGTSRLFGFRITENFNYPLVAVSLPDFWRRWHITLSSWCQNYIYSPVLGWSRNPYLALIVSFQVMGLWHAFSVNRIMWGLFFAAGVAAVSLTQKFYRRRKIVFFETWAGVAVSWALTQAYVCASWVFVIAESNADYLATLTVLVRLLAPVPGM